MLYCSLEAHHNDEIVPFGEENGIVEEFRASFGTWAEKVIPGGEFSC